MLASVLATFRGRVAWLGMGPPHFCSHSSYSLQIIRGIMWENCVSETSLLMQIRILEASIATHLETALPIMTRVLKTKHMAYYLQDVLLSQTPALVLKTSIVALVILKTSTTIHAPKRTNLKDALLSVICALKTSIA